MNKLGKAAGILIALVVLTIGGLSLFIRFYLTDERVRALILPPAEQALGRTVTIGAISVGLFSGITINDFAVKEADGKTDFVSAKAFVLRYNLLPLLQKKVELNEIRLEKPTIAVSRNAAGVFNFESLAVLKKDAAPPKPTPSSPATPAAGLPVAILVDQIKISEAAFSLRDATGELPTVDARADLAMKVSLGQDLSSLRYKGDLDLDGKAAHGDMKPALKGRISFDEKDLALAMDLLIGEEKARLTGKAEGYGGEPKVTVDVTSDQLNVDKLLAMAASMPKGKEKAAPKEPKPASAPGAAVPKGLEVTGSVAVAKALYQKITITDFKLRYRLAKGILNVSELGGSALGGRIESTAEIDLNRPDLAYKGDLRLNSMAADQLAGSFANAKSGLITGALGSSLRFNGSGTAWDTIKRTLSADGDFAVKNGSIPASPATTAISTLLGAPELETIAFKDLGGTFKIVEGGKVQLDTALDAAGVKASTKGSISLDGALDMPLALTLDQNLSQKVATKLPATKYLADSQGNTTLNLKLAGTLDKPQPTLDSGSVQKQAEQVIKGKILEKIGGGSGTAGSGQEAAPSPADSLLKGIFGK